MSGKAEELYEKSKGVIDIEYMPTVCHRCSRLLVHTYVRKGDNGFLDNPFSVLCRGCYKEIEIEDE